MSEWLCQNIATGHKTKINSGLAEVLKNYTGDYILTPLPAPPTPPEKEGV